MSNIQVGSVATRVLTGFLCCCVGFVNAQQSNGGPFSPAHATDYGYGGQAGPLTYNGHLVPETLSDAAVNGPSGPPQNNPGQPTSTNVRLPCSKTSATPKPCSTSKKRCWLVGSEKGIQLGPTGQGGTQGGTGLGQHPSYGNGQYRPTANGQGQLGIGQQKTQYTGHYGPLAGQHQPQVNGQHGQLPTGVGGGTGQGIQQPFPSIVEHAGQRPISVSGPHGYKSKPTVFGQPTGAGQLGGGLQQGASPIGTGQYQHYSPGVSPQVGTGALGTGYPGGYGQAKFGDGHFGGGAAVPHHFGQSVNIGIGSSPFSFDQTGRGKQNVGSPGQVGAGQPQTGSLGKVGAGHPQTGTSGQVGERYPQTGGLGQVGLGQTQGGGMMQPGGDWTTEGVGQGGIASPKIKHYTDSGISAQQPTLHHTGLGGQYGQMGSGYPHSGSLGQSGQQLQGSADYRPIGHTQSFPKFGMGQNVQAGQGTIGQMVWIPQQQGVRYPSGAQIPYQPHQGNGHLAGSKVKYPNGSQPALTPQSGTASQPHTRYPLDSRFPSQHGAAQSSQGTVYPTGSKVIVQQGAGHSTSSQIASQQISGYPGGAQVISQQLAGYPLGSKTQSQRYPSVQIASQQKIGYPSGSQIAPQQWIGYPSGPQLSPQQGVAYPSGSQLPPQPGVGYPTGSIPTTQYGMQQPTGGHAATHQGSNYPTGSKFGIPQSVGYPGGVHHGAQPVPFQQASGYPTGLQTAPQHSIQYPSGVLHGAKTTSIGTQPSPGGYTPLTGGKSTYPHLSTGQLQGWQQPQYPVGLPGSGLTNAQIHGQGLQQPQYPVRLPGSGLTKAQIHGQGLQQPQYPVGLPGSGLTKAQIHGQGLQQPQYPVGLPGSGLTKAQIHGQGLGATLNLQPPPPGFRYSLKPK